MTDVTPTDLQAAIERQHGCRAFFIATELVRARHAGQIVWDGTVHHFRLEGHPRADLAFAWSSPTDGGTERRFFAVLRAVPILTARQAVQATIAARSIRSVQKTFDRVPARS